MARKGSAKSSASAAQDGMIDEASGTNDLSSIPGRWQQRGVAERGLKIAKAGSNRRNPVRWVTAEA